MNQGEKGSSPPGQTPASESRDPWNHRIHRITELGKTPKILESNHKNWHCHLQQLNNSKNLSAKDLDLSPEQAGTGGSDKDRGV